MTQQTFVADNEGAWLELRSIPWDSVALFGGARAERLYSSAAYGEGDGHSNTRSSLR